MEQHDQHDLDVITLDEAAAMLGDLPLRTIRDMAKAGLFVTFGGRGSRTRTFRQSIVALKQRLASGEVVWQSSAGGRAATAPSTPTEKRGSRRSVSTGDSANGVRLVARPPKRS